NYNNFTENLNNISNFIEKLPFEEQTGSIKKVYHSQDTEIFYENENLEQIDDQRIETNTNEITKSRFNSKMLSQPNSYLKINQHSSDVTEKDNNLINDDSLKLYNPPNDISMFNQKIKDGKYKYNPLIQDLQNHYPAGLNRIEKIDKSHLHDKEIKQVENDQIGNLEQSSITNEILIDNIKQIDALDDEGIPKDNKSINNHKRLRENENIQKNEENFTEIYENFVKHAKCDSDFQGNSQFRCDKNSEVQKQPKVQNQLNNFNQSNILNPPNNFGENKTIPNTAYNLPSQSENSNQSNTPCLSGIPSKFILINNTNNNSNNLFTTGNFSQPFISYQLVISNQHVISNPTTNLYQQPIIIDNKSTLPTNYQTQNFDISSKILNNPVINNDQKTAPNNDNNLINNISQKISNNKSLNKNNGRPSFNCSKKYFIIFKKEILKIFKKYSFFSIFTQRFISSHHYDLDMKFFKTYSGNPFRQQIGEKFNLNQFTNRIERKYGKEALEIASQKYISFLTNVNVYYQIKSLKENLNKSKYEYTDLVYHEISKGIIYNININCKFADLSLSEDQELIIYKVIKSIIKFLEKISQDIYISNVFPEIKIIASLYFENFDKHTFEKIKWNSGKCLTMFIKHRIKLLEKKFPLINNDPEFSKRILETRIFYIYNLLIFLNMKRAHLLAYILLSIKSYYLRLEGELDTISEINEFDKVFKMSVSDLITIFKKNEFINSDAVDYKKFSF
ncbi:hypothetical protein DMUE_3649, partial [Dictyocoela muelleri]